MIASLRRLLVFVLAGFAAACGVTAGNPGDGGKPRFMLAGAIQMLEGPLRPMIAIELEGPNGELNRAATAATDGTFTFEGLPPGAYSLQVAENYHQSVYLASDMTLQIGLPIPAAPGRFRHVPMGPYYFCLLWDDNSGLETGSAITGMRAYQAPANAIGVVESFLNYPTMVTLPGTPAVNDYAEAARRWNVAFAGEYAIAAYNKYGASLNPVTDVAALNPDAWNMANPPPNVYTLATQYTDVATCLSAAPPISASGIAFIEP